VCMQNVLSSFFYNRENNQIRRNSILDQCVIGIFMTQRILRN
jgi:nitrous oxidase accessory protein NosD